jgi:hypothetical protein
MGVAIYGRNDELLVPGRKQEDPATVANDGAAATLMWEEEMLERERENTGRLLDKPFILLR